VQMSMKRLEYVKEVSESYLPKEVLSTCFGNFEAQSRGETLLRTPWEMGEAAVLGWRPEKWFLIVLRHSERLPGLLHDVNMLSRRIVTVEVSTTLSSIRKNDSGG
jgi:hypothetical protein